MFDREEKELIDYGEKLNNIPKPDCIEEYIRNGIKLGKVRKRKIKLRIFTNIAAALTVIVLITSIRVSPAFAAYLSKVPGLEYIINLINYDRGIRDIVDNNFIQNVNVFEEHEDLVFTIKDMIIDNSKAVIFYSIENKGNHRFINLQEMRFNDGEGKDLIASVSWGGFINKDMNTNKKLEGSVELNFNSETVIPEVLDIRVKLKERSTDNPTDSEDKILSSEWKFRVPVDKKKFEGMSSVYELNQVIEIEKQKILFKSVTITPTRIAVDIEYDKNNSKRILRFDDIAILNEKGEKWGTIVNGISGSRVDEYNETLYFQSNYFTEPKELYLSGSSIRALDKEKLEVIVDTDHEKLLKAPDGKLILDSVNKGAKELSLKFYLVRDEMLDKNYAYNVLNGEFKDSRGKVYNAASSSSGIDAGNKQSLEYSFLTNDRIKGLIYLSVEDYPVRIKGDFKIKIK